MRRKKTHAEYAAEVEALNAGISVVDEYQGAHIKIAHRCAEGHKWNVTPTNVLYGNGCPHCKKPRAVPKTKKTHAEYVAQVEALGTGIEVVGEYAGCATPITHRCAEGHEWDAAPKAILYANGCPDCFYGNRRKDHAKYVAEVKALKKGFRVVGRYKNANTRIKHCCAKGHKWDAVPYKILEGSGCPHCDRVASDANVFYVWGNADDPGVYKVGITSQRCAEDRIANCARHNNMTANVIVMAAVDDARELERRALELGDDPHYPADIDGYTEFRRYSDAELGAVYQMAVQAA
jgi:hypothetical protein